AAPDGRPQLRGGQARAGQGERPQVRDEPGQQQDPPDGGQLLSRLDQPGQEQTRRARVGDERDMHEPRGQLPPRGLDYSRFSSRTCASRSDSFPCRGGRAADADSAGGPEGGARPASGGSKASGGGGGGWATGAAAAARKAFASARKPCCTWYALSPRITE